MFTFMFLALDCHWTSWVFGHFSATFIYFFPVSSSIFEDSKYIYTRQVEVVPQFINTLHNCKNYFFSELITTSSHQNEVPEIRFILLSVQFSHSVMSDSLWLHEPQHTRPPCPSPTPRVHPNPCPLSLWCHPTISSSLIPFSSCPQSQHQGLFKWVSSSHQVAKVLEFQFHHQSFQWIPRTDLL